MERLTVMEWVSSVLATIAGLNLLFIGIFNLDILSKLFTNDAWYRVAATIFAAGILYLAGDVWARVYINHHSHAHA